MGMFDNVEAETTLVKGSFQTKDTGCQLDTYKITDEHLYIYMNHKWYKHPWFTGELNFYTYHVDKKEWEGYVAMIEEGDVKLIEKVEYESK